MYNDVLCSKIMKELKVVDGEKIVNNINFFVNQYATQGEIDNYNAIINNALVVLDSSDNFLDNYAELLHGYVEIDRELQNDFSEGLKNYNRFMTVTVVSKTVEEVNKRNK